MNDDRAREGVEHLQAAAVEVIAALRAFLDVAEEVVRDPGAVSAFATGLVEMARAAAAPPQQSTAPFAGDSRVDRIRVS